MSLRTTTMRWAVAILAAFGIGAVIATWNKGSDASMDAPERRPDAPATAKPVETPSTATPVREPVQPTAAEPAAAQPASARPSMLAPVRWSKDLAAA